MDTTKYMLLGYLSANIAGDTRYTDTLQVWHSRSDESVTLTVKSTGASGGMDGNGNTTDMGIKLTVSLPDGVKAGEVATAIKKILADTQWNFKEYGKPTKNFRWIPSNHGVSVSVVQASLDHAREE